MSVRVRLPDGSWREFPPGTKAREVFSEIPAWCEAEAALARVNGQLRDVGWPLPEGEVVLEPVPLDSPEGMAAMRHSAAHILAGAVKRLFPGTKLAHGPPIDDGFFYDMDTPRPITQDDLPRIEEEMRSIIAADFPFERLEVPLEEARRICQEQGELYKLHYLGKAQESLVSFYRDGDFLDLCTGPHVPSTSWVRAFRITRTTGAYWLGDERNRQLQRVYGVAFPDERSLREHLYRLEEAQRRDHRRLGIELDLFSLHEEVGGGLVHLHPNGAVIRRQIEDYWLRLHEREGYRYVYTSHVVSEEIYRISGHLQNYADLMFGAMDVEGRPYRVRPMNCPGHIMIYKSRLHSYRELPLRLAELGTVYRFERSGVLHGLLRVRGFTIDDAHIFVAPDQVGEEIGRVFRLALNFLRAFGFDRFEVDLATRPSDKFVGSEEDWRRAEGALKAALDGSGLHYGIDEGGGAFYGPKIDIKVKDCLGRPWQCSTIQFDFNLPSAERFDLEYIDREGRRGKPMMIHRALMGSVERFLGVLIEHYAGEFPLWLAPVQAVVLPVTRQEAPYAGRVGARLRAAGLRVEEDMSDARMGQKVRTHTLRKVPYLLVVGPKEVASGGVAVRHRREGDQGMVGLEEFVRRIEVEAAPPPLPESS